jgi:ketol-acid reductoisomerase
VIDDHVRDNMRKLLSDIREGSFAQDWIEQMKTGEPKLNELREQAAEERIETVGAELRGLMHRVPQQEQPLPDPA